MELAVWFWALGTLPVAMAGSGAVALGPQPWLILPLGPAQFFVGLAEPPLAVRISLLAGPWFLWAEVPPRVALARAPGHALVALVRAETGPSLAWELAEDPYLSLFGSLGAENALGLRLRFRQLWGSILIRQGGLSAWCGLYF
ncbi:MAG: hypothetical protein NZ924_05055 [Candidatus Bipolaricaulota bacterium]|nr:hypothetical protein [Candidatus Bipolaricaulota bacterium]MDW8152258.1 hypothetical protein [Candidatus Bipolaricaulota bacterium]